MVGESDQKEKNESRKIMVAILALVLLLIIASFFMFSALSATFSPGLGLKDAAIIAFFVTAVLLIIFAIAAGDGLLGEIQYMLAGFFLFYIVFWLMIAWVF